jgi:hypothetical protein
MKTKIFFARGLDRFLPAEVICPTGWIVAGGGNAIVIAERQRRSNPSFRGSPQG